MGDSHASLLALGCLEKGMTKASYGTGSSIMMNTGDKRAVSENGLVTSIAWKRGGKLSYVLEGNVNYSAAVISWLRDDLGLI
ncbi:MAG: glycerol kinase, partial [Clostridia bacterium]|nr:glycerol kinase [Clostridia bacterium]